jgi:hypothetical protein
VKMLAKTKSLPLVLGLKEEFSLFKILASF